MQSVDVAWRSVTGKVLFLDWLFFGNRTTSGYSADHQRAQDGLVFRAPTSGRFYTLPSPDKPLFVTVGSELASGTVVCLLEVIKTFSRVAYTGALARVRSVLVADGADVKAGDPLLELDAV